MQEIMAYSTTLVMLGLVLARPRVAMGLRLGPSAAAAAGVIVLLALRVLSGADLQQGFYLLWRPLVTLVSIMLNTSAALRLGILDYFAYRIEPPPGRPVATVFRSFFILSVVTATVLNNDAAVLVLTPLVVRIIRRCYPDRADLVVPFSFVVFCAAGVAPLVISNPMNLIVAEYAGIGFNEYALRMVPIAAAGWIATYALLRLLFRREIELPHSRNGGGTMPALRLSRSAKQFLALMAVTLASYPFLSYVGAPVWAIAAASALLGVLLCCRDGRESPRGLLGDVSWPILVFLFCIFVFVLGLRNVGLVHHIAALYAYVPSSIAQIMIIGISSAAGSAMLNNHPMAILNAIAIHDLAGGTHLHVLAALVGGDLGPRLLPIGSLAGLLWLESLRQQGIHVRLSQFTRVGLVVTVPTLILSLVLLLAVAAAGA
jgi:arsenical pump membrane protein